jgi:hypothetical protein
VGKPFSEHLGEIAVGVTVGLIVLFVEGARAWVMRFLNWRIPLWVSLAVIVAVAFGFWRHKRSLSSNTSAKAREPILDPNKASAEKVVSPDAA